MLKQLKYLAGAFAFGLIAAPATLAQSITPANDGTATVVTPEGTQYDITGGTVSSDGTNLFHSFETFGLTQAEIANFIANPAIQNILGRVTGGSASVIDGLIQVSGSSANLYLLNPAGILFGPQSALNLDGSFTATTATGLGFGHGWLFSNGVANYAALVGNPTNLAFAVGEAGAIANTGSLTVDPGKALTLVGGFVINTGTLTAPGGQITVQAVPGENRVQINQQGSLLNLELAALPPEAKTSAVQALIPAHLPALLTGSGLGSATGITVNPDGSIRLTGTTPHVPTAAGTVVVSGRINTVGETGGRVDVLGDRVGLVGANIDASGTNGGGTVHIGGNYQGQGPLPNASRTFVSQNSQVRADALEAGMGGQVVVWADIATRFLGSISAQGGSSSGNGGFVEVSGRDSLDFRGDVNTLAAQGAPGTLLLDPTFIEVIAGAGSFTSLGDVDQFTDIDIPINQIDVSLINGATSNVILQSTGDILFSTPVNIANPGVGLTAEARNDIRAGGQNITADGNITLNAGRNITVGDLRTLGAGNSGTVSLTAANGNILIGTIGTDSDAGDGNGGSVFLSAPNGSITTGDIRTIAYCSGICGLPTFGDGGTVSIIAGTAITTGSIQTASFSATGNGGNVFLDPSGDIVVDWIDTHSDNGTGGDMTILTQSAFRALGTTTSSNGTLTSLLAEGGLGGGNIFIGFGSSTPFTIGNAAQNGTAAALATGSTSQPLILSTATPPLMSGFFSGASRGSIGINAVSRGGLDRVCAQNCTEWKPDRELEETSGAGSVVLTQDPGAAAKTAIANAERRATAEFANYFGTDFSQQVSLEDVQAALRAVPGQRSALLMVGFGFSDDPEAATKEINSDTAPLELVLITAQGQPTYIQVPGASRRRVLDAAERLRRQVTNPNLVGTESYLTSAQQLYRWLMAPLEAQLTAQGIRNIGFVMDEGLRSLPIAALHDGTGFLIEHYSVGLLPSLSLTDLAYRDLKSAQLLVAGASEFATQEALLAAPVEMDVLHSLWPGEKLSEESFTTARLKAARQTTPFGVIHLATHGAFLRGNAASSYLEFADGRLYLNQLRQLSWNNPPVLLLSLSACQTALGNKDAELGFAGLAVAAGAQTALASLWQVSDESTAGLMVQFYQQLYQGRLLKAEALRQAQLALLQGVVHVENDQLTWSGGQATLPPELVQPGRQDFSHPFYWAAFTMVGSPW